MSNCLQHSVLIAYPQNGYPVEEYNGKPIHLYIGKRARLLQRYLKEQLEIEAEARLLEGDKVVGLENYQCIVPFMVNLPQKLSAIEATNALYIQNPNVYTTIDLKADIIGFNFVDENNIPQIPTLDMFRANRNEMCGFIDSQKCDHFILKPEDSAGSLDQIILDRADEQNIESYLGKRVVMQPCYKEHDIFAINALMIDGKVEAHFGSINLGGLLENATPVDYIFNENVSNEAWKKIYLRILDFTRRFSKKHDVGGFIEIEFLQPKGTNKLFLLEVNPRISGWLESFYEDAIPFVEILIVPYLRHFGVHISKERQYDLSTPLKVYHPADHGKDASEFYDWILKEKESMSMDQENQKKLSLNELPEHILMKK